MSYQAAHRDDTFLRNKTLHVITPISNPKRYNSRYRLFEQFAAYMGRFPNVQLHPIELVFGDRDSAINHPNAIYVQGSCELWHKENLINIATAYLPKDWEYMAWIDADVQFVREDWADETLQLLQHYKVLQLFSHALDLDAHYRPLEGLKEACIFKVHNDPYTKPEETVSDSLTKGHPGYAWAIRRATLEAIGGLIEVGVVGSGDRHMACAMYGIGDTHAAQYNVPPGYLDAIRDWQEKAKKVINQDVGYMNGLVYHFFHGSKTDRAYKSRWSILSDNNFDPKTDVRKDSQGLLEWTGNNIGLRDGVRNYFARRNEDCIRS